MGQGQIHMTSTNKILSDFNEIWCTCWVSCEIYLPGTQYFRLVSEIFLQLLHINDNKTTKLFTSYHGHTYNFGHNGAKVLILEAKMLYPEICITWQLRKVLL